MDRQTKGRGRLGRSWFSDDESLYFSIAIRDFQPNHLSFFPLAAAVAMAKMLLKQANIHIGLKWPNDLFYQKKKLGGILCEAVVNGSQIKGIVIGIGININTDLKNTPKELKNIITSTLEITKKRLNIAHIAKAVRQEILQTCELLFQNGPAEIIYFCQKNDITKGRKVRLQNGQKGRVLGILADGSLEVKTQSEVLRVRSGEVHFLKNF